jgi:hypothetical protein
MPLSWTAFVRNQQLMTMAPAFRSAVETAMGAIEAAGEVSTLPQRQGNAPPDPHRVANNQRSAICTRCKEAFVY